MTEQRKDRMTWKAGDIVWTKKPPKATPNKKPAKPAKKGKK